MVPLRGLFLRDKGLAQSVAWLHEGRARCCFGCSVRLTPSIRGTRIRADSYALRSAPANPNGEKLHGLGLGAVEGIRASNTGRGQWFPRQGRVQLDRNDVEVQESDFR